MAYIYEILNDINDKIYIGKTEFDIDKRFKQHCQDAFRKRNEKRPLYNAMRKYGVDHFYIQLIEETDNPEEREMYWIKEKQSYHKGYNATLGGDGRHYLDYDYIIKTYKEIQNITETAKICKVSKDSVSDILKENNINIKTSSDIIRERTQKTVGMCDLKDKNVLIKTFTSVAEAAKYLIENKITFSTTDGISSHICHVCNGKRKNAYGYFWKYL